MDERQKIITDAWDEGRARPKLATRDGETIKDNKPPFILHPARLPKPHEINPRRWLYGTQLVRGFVTVLVAPGGTGKSSYAMGVGVACAAGNSILGEKIFERVNAAIINLEDPMDELERRLAALMIQHSVTRDELHGKLFLDDGEGRGLTMAAVGDDGYTIIHPDEAAMVEQINDNNIGVVICDPFAESHSLEENNNPQMVKAAAAWRRVARATDAAVLLVHHVRKGEASGIDAARGAKALTDSARVGLLLSPMSGDEGEQFGVGPEDRWQYVRLDDAKRNMAPAAKARWFRLAQQPLGNGKGIYPNGDNVAAVAVWNPPEQTIAMSVAQLNEALDVIAQPPAGWLYAPTRAGRDNSRWAGQVLVDLGMGEKQASALISQWLKNGTLYRDTFTDEYRNKRTGVRVNDHARPTN